VEAYLSGATHLAEANLCGAYLMRVNFTRTDLGGADLGGADLGGANLYETNFMGADLAKANLIEAELFRVAMCDANLSGANLAGANLKMADFRRADLTGAKLADANLEEANLKEAKLVGVDLCKANLRGADLGGADLGKADLSGADLTQAILVNTNFEGANLTSCSLYGISAWNVRLDGAIQSNLVITPSEESPIQVDNLEVAQFIYLLLSNEKIRNVIDTVGKKAVLILGRFTSERKPILDAIRGCLRESGYLPILFDFEKPGIRDTQETIVTLAGMVRFIIADITDPKSIPQELAAIVPNLPSVPVQPLLQSGFEPWGMYDHIKRYPWVLPLLPYEDGETLLRSLVFKIIAPAEAMAMKQQLKRLEPS
jgi:uncharacterized protein YjbI with pentapeptide repeats